MAQRIVVDIVAETAQLRAGLEQANQQLSGLQTGVSKINKVTSAVAGIGVASAGLSKATGFITKTTEAAADLAETVNKSQVIFGSASKDIEAFAETAVESIGASKRQAIEGAATFGIFGKAAGLTGKDLANFSTDLLKLGADLGSINNVGTEQVIGALGAALRGEAEPVRQFGILLNEDAIKAEALALGLTNANVNTTKVALAQAKAQKAAKDYAAAVRESGENSAEAGIKQALLEKANEDLAKATSGISEKLTAQQKILAINSLLYQQGSYALDDFKNTGDSYANVQKKIEAQQENVNAEIGTIFLPIMQQVQKITKTVVDVFTQLPGPLQTTLVGFALLVATVGPLLILFNSVKTAIVALEITTKLWSATTKIAAGVQTAFNAVMAANPIALVVLGIIALIAIIVVLVKNWDTVTEVVGKVWNAIKNFASDAWEALKGFGKRVSGFVSDVIDRFKELPSQMLNIGKNIAEGLWNGIQSMANWLRNRIYDFFGNLIPGWAKKILGIGSPSKVFAGFGKNIVEGLAQGISTAESIAKNATFNLGNAAISGINSSNTKSSAGINITINAGLGTNGPALGRQVSSAIKQYGKVSTKAVAFGAR